MEDGARELGVAVVGGGWAGCAAAATLAEAGLRVVLLEAAPSLGGRARRVVRDGMPLDNGQHLMLGAYHETLALLARLRPPDAPAGFVRRPLAIVPLSPRQPGALRLVSRRAPGRAGLALALLTARGLTWSERLANVRFMRALERDGWSRPPRETVAKMLKPLPPRVVQALWEPLCLAALNTPIAAASAQVFAQVLGAAFGARGSDSDFVLATGDLGALLPDRAAALVAARGGTVRTGVQARVVAAGATDVTLAVGGRGEPLRARAAIVAVGPHQLEQAFAQEFCVAQPAAAALLDVLGTLAYEPIVTVYLGYGAAIPLPAPICRLDDAPGQWVVDRPDAIAGARGAVAPPLAQVLSVVMSASGPHTAMSHEALVRATDEQLRRALPALPPLAWSYAIAEKRATYACTPLRPRPAEPRVAPGVYLCGDYVDAVYPATLEAAVRSGIAAARMTIDELRRRRANPL